MKIRTHLIVSKAGNVRVNKTGTGIKPNEIDITVNLDIPDAFFQRPTPVINLALPNHIGQALPLDQVIDLTAEQVAASLALDVENVRDGLRWAANPDREYDDDEVDL